MGEVVLDGVTKRFGTVTAVDEVSFTVRDGELLVLVGPSGCGKTTVLRIIAGLDTPTDGDVYLDGTQVTAVPARKRNVGFAFEDFALFPHLDVRENISFNLRMRGGYDDVPDRVNRIVELLDIDDLLDRSVDQLSGGQKQRVALGRAIVSEPSAFLLDEPFANLDAKLRSRMQTEVARIQDRLEITTVHVTHDQEEALSMGDRIAVLNDGTIQQLGSPEEIYDRPTNVFVARFIGTPTMNFLHGRYAPEVTPDRIEIDDAEFAFSIPEPLDTDVTTPLVGIRPEHIAIHADPQDEPEGLPATIEYVEFHGANRFVHVRLATGSELVARVDGGRTLTQGDAARLILDRDQLHLFDPATGTRIPNPRRDADPGGITQGGYPNRADVS